MKIKNEIIKFFNWKISSNWTINFSPSFELEKNREIHSCIQHDILKVSVGLRFYFFASSFILQCWFLYIQQKLGNKVFCSYSSQFRKNVCIISPKIWNQTVSSNWGENIEFLVYGHLFQYENQLLYSSKF